MKNVFRTLTFLLFVLPALVLQAQVSDYCGLLKVSVQNVKEVSNGLEFDVYLRSAKKSNESCGDLFLGHTDIWIKLSGGDFSNATIEKLGECTLSPAITDNPISEYFVQQAYTSGTSVKIVDGRAVLNVSSPSAYNEATLNVNLAYLDTKPRTHMLGRYRITDYSSTQQPVLTIQNMDKGAGVEFSRTGYDRFCSKSHTNAIDGNRVTSYAIKVIPDAFLRDDLTKFDARRVEMKSAKVDWEIERSAKVEKYMLERSQDGINWEVIEDLEGSNNVYEFLDEGVYDGKAIQQIFHYRLKMESANDYDYSEVKTVAFSNIIMTGNPDASNEGLTIYPNPSSEGVFVDMTGLDERVNVDKIQIMDINGKLVLDMEVLPNVRKEYIKFGEKEEMAKGMYIVQLISGEMLVDQKKLEVQ